MASSLGNTIYYCCVCKGNRILYTYNSGDRELESLAGLCLENAPCFHAWYFHTMGGRTYGFLIEDAHVYFAIADPVLGNSKILRFLELVRDGFKKVAKSGFQDELVPVIRRLISSLESVSRPATASAMTETETERSPPSDGSVSTKAPLLGKVSGNHERKKMKDRVIEVRDGAENYVDKGLKTDVSQEPMGAISLQKSTSFTRLRNQQIARRLWCRQVRIVIAVDALICLVLFAVWLAICRGFQCVS
uniref:Putative VAMP-like protein At1g33475 n=1 Tax=Anthurium amnicola TaxID=1678845 RepID=A0A1D1Z119_9ARAE